MFNRMPALPLPLLHSAATPDDVMNSAEQYVLQVMGVAIADLHQAGALIPLLEAAIDRMHPDAANQIFVELSCVIQYAAFHERDIFVDYPPLSEIGGAALRVGLLHEEEVAKFVWWFAASAWSGMRAATSGSYDREVGGDSIRPLFAAAVMALHSTPNPVLAIERQWESEAIPF